MRVPLHKGGNWKDPGPVVAYAVVDDEDFPAVSRHRWRLSDDGYAVRTTQRSTPPVCPECGWVPRPGVRVANSVSVHRAKAHRVPLGKPHSVSMHRQIMGLETGDKRQVDHQDRDRLNNSRSNLRIIDATYQAQNQRGLEVFNGKPVESRYRNVYKVKKRGKWTGRWKVCVAGRYVGIFTSEVAAAEAAREWRRLTMPYALD